MNEVQRLAYLGAMGISSYIPRVELPGAKASALCDMTGSEAAVETAVAAPIEGKVTLQQLQSTLASAKKPMVEKPIVAPAVQMQAPANPTVKTAPTMAVHFQWAIFQPVPSLLLLVPASHLAQAQLSLLKNILAAVGILGSELGARENFVWPPAARSNLLPHSLADARETLQALLEGYQLKQPQAPVNNVLVFDSHLGKTLFDDMRIRGLTLRILPSLHEMTANAPQKIAEAKRVTWQNLKDLKV